MPSSPRLAKSKPHESVITVKSVSTRTGSTVSFPSDLYSDYTASTSAFSRSRECSPPSQPYTSAYRL
jgi:hypothetical protein